MVGGSLFPGRAKQWYRQGCCFQQILSYHDILIGRYFYWPVCSSKEGPRAWIGHLFYLWNKRQSGVCSIE